MSSCSCDSCDSCASWCVTMCCARLAENLARKIYSESISRHLQQRGSQLRTVLDPFQLFPLELPVSNSVFRWVWQHCQVL